MNDIELQALTEIVAGERVEGEVTNKLCEVNDVSPAQTNFTRTFAYMALRRELERRGLIK